MIAQLDTEQIRLRPGRAAARLLSHVLLQGRPLTTRARWLNHIILQQFSLIKRLPQLRLVHKPIFIIGTGRSGTTILGKLLSLHPEIVFLNEPKAIWYTVHFLDDLIGNYSRGEARYRLDENMVSSQIIQVIHRLYGYCLFLTRSHRILDKYPEMIFRVPFLQAVFPDARFLFLVRNGWDTCRSIESWSRTKGIVDIQQEKQDWWGADRRKWHLLLRDVVATNAALSPYYDDITAFTHQEDMAAVEWIVTMQEGIKLVESRPQQVRQIHYEQLLQEPKYILAEILAFCDLAEDDKLFRYAQRTLKQRPAKPAFELHATIKETFLETMATLGYAP